MGAVTISTCAASPPPPTHRLTARHTCGQTRGVAARAAWDAHFCHEGSCTHFAMLYILLFTNAPTVSLLMGKRLVM